MACCGQKGAVGGKCCLCSQASGEGFPWGAKKICWRCERKQRELIKERKKLNERAEKLLAGISK
jgi:hypothetical protein